MSSHDESPWAPLRQPIFRAFWIASLASNFGTWIHEIGAGWLMTKLDSSPEMVAAVRTAMSLPIVLFAIPAGVLADRVDRRRLLLMTQWLMLWTTATLATLTVTGFMTPWLLLSLSLVMGFGLVVHVPTWQASVPELVPKHQIARAVALGSISFNLARAAGPAIGGILIASAGVWIAFAVNAVSFAGVIAVLTCWRRDQVESTRGLTFRMSLYQGLRFVTRSHTIRNAMIGVILFVFPASVFWSLLPLYARSVLGWEADGFGLLVAMVGLGAVFAASILPRLRRRFGTDATVVFAMLIFAAGLLTIARCRVPTVILAATFVMGSGWMMTLTTLNATAQVTLPRRLRARGMGCYLTAMAFSMSFGSLVWGQLASVVGIMDAQSIAAVTLTVTAAISLRFRLGSSLH
jgi:MFS family permease